MSEYSFNYKCIKLSDQASKPNEKALQFKLFQDYENGGELKIQIYIPEKCRQHVKCVKLYFDEYGVDFPEVKDDEDKIWLNRKTLVFNSLKTGGLSTLNEQNCIYIRSNKTLSGTGLIGFVMDTDENGIPSIENTYKFVTNFLRKETISYLAIEHNRSIEFEITYPKVYKNIRLNVLSAQGHKPLLIKDKNDSNYLYDKNNQKCVIELKRTSSTLTTENFSFECDKTRNSDFRLVFEDESNANFYILSDESMYTLEDKKIQKAYGQTKRRKKGIDVKHRCPYCGNELHEYEGKDSKKGVFTCSGKRIGEPYSKDYPKIIVCDQFSSEEKHRHFGLNQNEYLVLPDNYSKRPVINIALAGSPDSGKTIFISSLINMQKRQGESAYDASPFLLTLIQKKFDSYSGRKNISTKEIKTQSLSKTGSVINFTDQYQGFRAFNGFDSRYVMTVGESVEKQTRQNLTEPLSFNPVGFDMGKLGFLYLYDVPGECFKNEYTGKVRSFDVADGIIAVIDGDDTKTEDPFKKFVYAIKKISNLTKDNKKIEDIPIAIVYTKLDLKLPSEAKLDNYENCFDENCHLAREDMLSYFPKSRKYHGSQLEKHIEYSSYEIEHFLKSLNSDNFDTISSIKETYHNIKFFACSSLGSNNCLDSISTTNAKIQFKPKRLRLELPIIWLMYMKGLIRK